jgi:glycosyltransferase involved in cell wall biosynthesis
LKLSIIIPLYNEESLIAILLEQLISTKFPSCVTDHEIIIVDDCSSDNSYKTVSSFSEKYPFIKIFRHSENKGKGASVKKGFELSSGDTILIQDADLELTPLDIPSLINAMDELKVEFINGSRYLPGVNRPIASYKRYIANKIFTYLTSILIDVRLTDMACGYKLIKRSLFEKIKLKENRFGFEAELIIKALRIKKNNVAEVPVRYYPRNEGEGKKLRSSDGLKILKTIFKYGLLRMY